MIAKQEIDKVICQNEEIRMLNIRNWKKKEETKEGEKGNKKKMRFRRVRLKLRGRSRKEIQVSY